MKRIFSTILKNKMHHSHQWFQNFISNNNKDEITPRDIKIKLLKKIIN